MSDWIWDIWRGFGPETKSAIIQGLSTLVAALTGAIAIGWQLRRQGSLNRENVGEIERRRIKAELYEEVRSIYKDVSDSTIEFANQMLSVGESIEVAAQCYAQKSSVPLPAQRVPNLIEYHYKYQNAGTKFIYLIEQRMFVDPRMSVFITAINSVLHDVRSKFHDEFFPTVIPLLPVDGPHRQTLPYQPPTIERAAAIKRIAKDLFDCCNELGSYADDFIVEMQNLLVADLFGTKVEHRRPLNPALKVIKLEDFEELERFFSSETDWGQQRAYFEARNRQQFQGRSDQAPNAN